MCEARWEGGVPRLRGRYVLGSGGGRTGRGGDGASFGGGRGLRVYPRPKVFEAESGRRRTFKMAGGRQVRRGGEWIK